MQSLEQLKLSISIDIMNITTSLYLLEGKSGEGKGNNATFIADNIINMVYQHEPELLDNDNFIESVKQIPYLLFNNSFAHRILICDGFRRWHDAMVYRDADVYRFEEPNRHIELDPVMIQDMYHKFYSGNDVQLDKLCALPILSKGGIPISRIAMMARSFDVNSNFNIIGWIALGLHSHFTRPEYRDEEKIIFIEGLLLHICWYHLLVL